MWWHRKKVRENKLAASPGENPGVPTELLLAFLMASGDDRSLWLWRELLACLAWVAESGNLWERCSGEAVDIPAPRGHGRARRLNPRFLDGLAKMAGKGEVARTGGRMAKALKWALRRRGLLQGVEKWVGNLSQRVRAKRYRDSCADVFTSRKVRIISLANDASRVSGKEVLYSAMYSPEQGLACWGDPMVLSGNQGNTKWPFQPMSKSV